MTTEPQTVSPDPANDAGLSDVLKQLETMGDGGSVQIRSLIDQLADRGPAVAVFLLSAPFIFIPIPGLSTAVGLAVFGLSLAIVIGGRPWVPGFIGRRNVSPENLRRFSQGTRRVLDKLQRIVRPRMTWLTAPGLYRRLAGVSLISATILFALPLPIPGNNIPPAIGMTLLALGLLQRDGLLVLIGHLYTLLLWVILIVVVIVSWNAIVGQIRERWGSDPTTQPASATAPATAPTSTAPAAVGFVVVR